MMDDRISNDYINTAIDELISILGVKEEPTMPELLALLRKKETRQCIKEIAKHMGLDIEINLFTIPKDYKASNTNKFESSQLVKTDWRGRGVEGITAQVLIPGNLPMYGHSKLKDFPFDVRVSENCYERPQTFITIMAHEIAHVLLHSLYYPQKDNEVYTDLTPMILGFSKIVELGRRTVESTATGSTTTTNTTTYGYLTDKQFFFARDKINTLIKKYRHDNGEILCKVTQIKLLLSNLEVNFSRFKRILQYLDENQNRKIKNQDGQRIVQFHSFGYTSVIEMAVVSGKMLVAENEKYYTGLNYYTNTIVATMHSFQKKLDSTIAGLEKHDCSLKDDIRVLLRNVDLVYKIKHALSSKT